MTVLTLTLTLTLPSHVSPFITTLTPFMVAAFEAALMPVAATSGPNPHPHPNLYGGSLLRRPDARRSHI